MTKSKTKLKYTTESREKRFRLMTSSSIQPHTFEKNIIDNVASVIYFQFKVNYFYLNKLLK